MRIGNDISGDSVIPETLRRSALTRGPHWRQRKRRPSGVMYNKSLVR